MSDTCSVELSATAGAVLAELVGISPGRTGPGCSPSGSPSIHETILPRLRRAEDGDLSALSPGPIVDRVMGRLVELLVGPVLPSVGASAPSGPVAADVEREVEAVLDADPLLADRAADVRRAAALAEAALECHHARLVAGPGATPTGPATRARSGDAAWDPVAAVLPRFPYLANYRLLTWAEVAGLERVIRPRHITFCGAGALPLTGVYYHRWTGASVRLVEIDPDTSLLARHVIARLERSGAVERGALEVVTADAGDIDLCDTDVVVVAGLLGQADRDRLVAGLGVVGDRQRPVLIVRSAHGLVARFAYPAVDPAAVGPGSYRHIGSVVPVGRGRRSGVRLLATADRTVLNTSDYFVPTDEPPSPAVSGGPDCGAIQPELLGSADGHEARLFCLAIIAEVFGHGYRADWHADLDALPGGDHDYVPERRGTFLVARHGGRIVGTAGLRTLSTAPHLAARFAGRYPDPDRVGSVWRTYLHPSFRSRGLGAHLVADLEARAAALGLRHLYLHTSGTSPRSVAFWEKSGYRIMATDDDGDRTVHLDKPIAD